MRISIIGTGYVGAVTGICLAEMGHEVHFVDVDRNKLDAINSGKSPIFEPGLEPLLVKNHERIRTGTDISNALLNTELTIICVGTPQKADGSHELKYISEVARQIGKSMVSDPQYHTIIIKSTVLPGTTENFVLPILLQESGKQVFKYFGIGSNPEFLKEGSAVEDFFHTDRVIIGTNDQKTREILETLYQPLHAPIFSTNIRTAEMIKYVSNAFLATKISFANEIGNLCKKVGVDSYEVFRGVGMDARINSHFFRSGIGFGGSCFPKDVKALLAYGELEGIDLKILKAVMRTNDMQPQRMIDLLKKHMDIKRKKIGILGLAFKPDTDDIRESRAIQVVKMLLHEGASVLAYDPLAMPAFQKIFPEISYARTPEEVLGTDAVLIVTEWRDFLDLDYRGKMIIDGRRIENARKHAEIYEGMCW
jgi:UDPglucose 6-dehydrogenase